MTCQLRGEAMRRADRAAINRMVNAGDLKFTGYAHCPIPCQYGDEIEATTRQALASDGERLTQVWRSRFSKSRETVVAEATRIFGEYSAQSPSHGRGTNANAA